MKKFRLYYDKDRETEWINNLAAEGYALTSYFAGFYTFEKTEPGKYIYQMDMGSRFFSVTDEYREFMEDTGVEIIQNWGFWVILRKPASEGNFELYTDADSNIEHYTKICRMFKVVSVIEILAFFLEAFSVLHGFEVGLIFMVLLGILAVALTSAAVQTKRTIQKFKEDKGIISSSAGTSRMSLLLPIGILLNFVMMICRGYFTSVQISVIQGFAILLIGLGGFISLHTKYDDEGERS